MREKLNSPWIYSIFLRPRKETRMCNLLLQENLSSSLPPPPSLEPPCVSDYLLVSGTSLPWNWLQGHKTFTTHFFFFYYFGVISAVLGPSHVGIRQTFIPRESASSLLLPYWVVTASWTFVTTDENTKKGTQRIPPRISDMVMSVPLVYSRPVSPW